MMSKKTPWKLISIALMVTLVAYIAVPTVLNGAPPGHAEVMAKLVIQQVVDGLNKGTLPKAELLSVTANPVPLSILTDRKSVV